MEHLQPSLSAEPGDQVGGSWQGALMGILFSREPAGIINHYLNSKEKEGCSLGSQVASGWPGRSLASSHDSMLQTAGHLGSPSWGDYCMPNNFL